MKDFPGEGHKASGKEPLERERQASICRDWALLRYIAHGGTLPLLPKASPRVKSSFEREPGPTIKKAFLSGNQSCDEAVELLRTHTWYILLDFFNKRPTKYPGCSGLRVGRLIQEALLLPMALQIIKT